MDALNRVGEKYITNEGYNVEVIDFFDSTNCTVLFDDGLILKNIVFFHLKNGEIKNPNHKSVFGVGYLGQGKYKTSVENKITKSYSVWKSMLTRCYDKNYHDKNNTYVDCFTCSEWHNFQVFSKWFKENYSDGYTLDKDILFKGNKEYSPFKCCFIPNEVNLLFIKCNKTRGDLPIGVRKVKNRFRADATIDGKKKYLGSFNTPEEAFQSYKTNKEMYIKKVADKWKNKIPLNLYKTMHNYQVEITD